MRKVGRLGSMKYCVRVFCMFICSRLVGWVLVNVVLVFLILVRMVM